MNCSKCGYSMDALDEECRKCHGKGITARPSVEPQHSSVRNIRKWAVLAALCPLLLFGCYLAWFKAYTRSQQDEVWEAVLRRRMRYVDAEKKRILFVSVGGHDPTGEHDPTPSFLARFKYGRISVRKGSQAKSLPTHSRIVGVEGQGSVYWVDKDTGEPGTPLWFSSPIWAGPFKCSVSSGFPDDFLMGGTIDTMVKKNGDWGYPMNDIRGRTLSKRDS